MAWSELKEKHISRKKEFPCEKYLVIILVSVKKISANFPIQIDVNNITIFLKTVKVMEHKIKVLDYVNK